MAFGLKTYPDKAPSWKTWRKGLNLVLKPEEQEKLKPKDHPLYKMLKARKEDNMTL